MSAADFLRLAWAGMHPDRVRDLLGRYGSARRLVGAIGAGRVDVPAHVRAAVQVPASDRYGELERLQIEFITADHADYPGPLRALPDHPPFLFLQGAVPARPAVAVVGTRRGTAYGRRVARGYGAALAAAGVTVVSGLARGIDGAAHWGSIDGGGEGIAVLGCGLDTTYPREHAGLRRALLESGGLAVSEYPPGAAPLAWRFPPRNRIISGLAAAVVVVEANVTGGALITARTALSQGREVFATPGDVTRAASTGTNHLIRDGAVPVLDADDLLETLSLLPDFAATLGPPGRAPGGEDAPGEPDGILALVGRHGIDVEDLAAGLGLGATRTLALLAELEAAGRVVIEGSVVSLSTRA